MQNAGDGAGGIGSAAEAKDIDAIAIFVSVHQVTVGIANIGQKAGSESHALDARPVFFDVGAGRGRAHGADPGMIIPSLLPIDDEGAVQLDNIRVRIRIVEAVPCAIAAEDNVLAHRLLRGCIDSE